MTVLNVNVYYDDRESCIEVLLDDKETRSPEYNDLKVYDNKTLFLNSGLIIKNAIVIDFCKTINYNGLCETKIRFAFSKIITEEEYENE